MTQTMAPTRLACPPWGDHTCYPIAVCGTATTDTVHEKTLASIAVDSVETGLPVTVDLILQRCDSLGETNPPVKMLLRVDLGSKHQQILAVTGDQLAQLAIAALTAPTRKAVPA